MENCLVAVIEAEKNKPTEDVDMDVADEHPQKDDEAAGDEDFGEGEDGMAGWDDEEEYEDVNEPGLMKKSSTLDDQMSKYNIHLGSTDSINIFKKLKVVKEALETDDIIKKNLEALPNVFSVQIFEALLMFKLSIDLNFMTTEPHIFESLGFETFELVEFLFIFDDNKLLMFYNDESIYEKDMSELCGLGILKIEFIQQSNDHSENRYQNYLQLLHETFFNKDKDGVSIAEELKTMSEDDLVASKATLMEMGFTSKESDDALKTSKYSISGAIDYLFGKKKGKGKKPTKTAEEAYDDLALFDPKNLLFSNISGIELKENSVLNYFRFMVYSLDSILNYCCICRDRLPKPSTKIRCCGKELCEFSFEEALGIFITPEIKSFPDSFTLDLSIFSECVMGGRAAKTFEPFPSFFLKDKEMRTKRGYLDNIKEAREKGGEAKDVKESNKDLKTIRNLFKFIPAVDKCLAKCSDDQILIKTLEKQTKDLSQAQDIYKLLRYLCLTNRVNFKHLTGDSSISKDTNVMEYLIYNQDASQEQQFQQLKEKNGSIWTFHGSSIENWYSILRNGPRNLSNTKMMTAGAAYGAGVYSAKAFATASGYSSYRGYYGGATDPTLGTATSWKHSIIKQRCVIGILEIIKNSSYNKSGDYDIVVCPDDHCIMLRYIWVFTQGGTGTTYSLMSTA